MGMKLPIDSKHIDTRNVWAEDVFYIGRNTSDGPEHILWRPDCKRAPTWMTSIRNEGQIAPVILRKAKVRDEDGNIVERMECVVGLGRGISIMEINKQDGLTGDDRVPLHAKILPPGTTDEQILLIIEAENSMRKQDASPIEKAQSAHRMHHRFNVPLEKIAKAQYGENGTVAQVRANMKLLELDASVQKAVTDGAVKPSTALTLISLPKNEQAGKVAEWTANPASVPTVKEAKRDVANARKPPEQRSADVKKPLSVREINSVLTSQKKLDEQEKPRTVDEVFVAVAAALHSEEPNLEALDVDTDINLKERCNRLEDIIKRMTKSLRVLGGHNKPVTVSGLNAALEGKK